VSDQDLELERLRRAFAARGAAAPPSGACPPADRLWAAVHGQLAAEEVRPLVAHLADCAACAEAWRLARAVDAPAAGVAASTAAPQPAGGRWAAIAAGIAAVVLAGVLLRQRPTSGPEYRDPGVGPGAVRSLLNESRALPRGDFRLRWTQGPAGATYAVQVVTEKLEPIAEARGLSSTEFLVPPERLASIPSGTRLLWRVEAVTPDGARVSSATFVAPLE
jgi:hypothetical protein